LSGPDVSESEDSAFVTITSSDSENQTGGELGYVSCKKRRKYFKSWRKDFLKHWDGILRDSEI
jgi:hypothetical protein